MLLAATQRGESARDFFIMDKLLPAAVEHVAFVREGQLIATGRGLQELGLYGTFLGDGAREDVAKCVPLLRLHTIVAVLYAASHPHTRGPACSPLAARLLTGAWATSCERSLRMKPTAACVRAWLSSIRCCLPIAEAKL